MVVVRCLGFAFVVVGVACGGSGTDTDKPGKPAFSPDELDAVAAAMLGAHNDARASATPTPNPALPDLTYNEDLADTAQAWSAGCVFEHSEGNLGENLAFFSGDASTATDVVTLWATEVSDYDYGSNSCRAGAQCGHYTQIVWRDTRSVGCGASSCTIQGTSGTYWVCNYDPPGNFIGERPY